MKKIWIGISILVVVVLAVVLVTTQTKILTHTRKQPEVVKIGAILPLTGDAAKYGRWITNGMEIAVEEVNAKGGIGGKEVVLKIQDSKTNAAQGVNAFQYLMQREAPAVVMTTLTSVCKAIIPIAGQNRVIVFANSTLPGLTDNHPFVFRNVTNLASDVPAAVDYASYKLKRPETAIIWRNDEFGLWGSAKFTQLYTENGGRVVISESYNPDIRDFRTILIKVASKHPQFVYLLGYSEVGLIARQARELGYKWNYLGITTMGDPEASKLAEGALEGAIHTEPAADLSSDAPHVVTYREAYRRKYGEKPEVWGATFYDAVKIFALAARDGNLSADSLREKLLKIQDYEGVSGKTSFLPNGDVLKPVELHQIRNGRSVPLE